MMACFRIQDFIRFLYVAKAYARQPHRTAQLFPLDFSEVKCKIFIVKIT
jgi:hypothetical protein